MQISDKFSRASAATKKGLPQVGEVDHPGCLHQGSVGIVGDETISEQFADLKVQVGRVGRKARGVISRISRGIGAPRQGS